MDTHSLAIDAARRRWRDAESFAQMCALGAEFVRGELPFFPGWGAATLDAESDAISAYLGHLNDGGFLTCASQPGIASAASNTLQRAFVVGFAVGSVAERIERLRAPLVGVVFSRHGGAGRDEPMTMVDGEARVLAGRNALDDELALFEGVISARAHDELARARWVGAWDQRFGARDDLWRELERCVGIDG